MVLKKRQDYGFNGFHVPFIPRAPRSARRGLQKKKVEDSQICAFELLAALAGKLLQESESSASSSASETNDQPAIGDNGIKEEQDKPLKIECLDQGSCEESVFIPEFTAPSSDKKFLLKECPRADSDSILERSSIITNSDSSEKASSDVKSAICKSKSPCDDLPCKIEGGSPDSGEYGDGYVENGFSQQQEADGLGTGGLTIDNTSSLKDPMELCMKFPALVNSENNVKLTSCRNSVPNASSLRLRNSIKLGIKDDDENFSRYNKSGIKPRAYRYQSRIGDRRIRKLLTSKYWKVAPKLKDCELSKVAFLDGGMKPLYRKRKVCYGRERYQHDTLYKKRKFPDHSLVVTSDGGFSSESVCNSPEKSKNVDKNISAPVFHGVTVPANGVSSSIIGHHASFHSKDSHVKFSIKSFRIPELFIEVPETTTVGLLKRTVMDAVTGILGGGLRVGMLLHGKKVRDDNRTLSQTGISSKENLDTLGFTLEPGLLQTPTVCTEDSPLPLPCNNSQLAVRSPTAPVLNSGNSDAPPDPLALTNSGNNLDSNHELISSHNDKLTDKTLSDSRALVAVPPVSVEALAVVPVNQKARRSELVQRRTRRPFSVSEVEALVQAVEELGTGRWRDVKLRSFENADHRTYVDLKDKWKTLVHTAKIAPQQRRGEPVPQELLDRVLAAHAYWSQHQAKQHGKNQAGVLKITEGHAGRNGGGGEGEIHLL
ncbi:telomere repeat-binding protein 4 isoform X2 [Jatropha curcas]|uniref:telomere repeat-binding protein 4 isoform X2 n=1 Tax=Jatropha curcas TaxID=180498 RepID=UPI0005FAC97B|nr:telomere repeat-binding protein 4 isoform X2 [Jatropha curcas]